MNPSVLNIILTLIIAVLVVILLNNNTDSLIKVKQLEDRIENYNSLNEEYLIQLDSLTKEKELYLTMLSEYFVTIDSLNSHIEDRIKEGNKLRDEKNTEILSVVGWNYTKRDSFWAKEFDRVDTLLLPKKIRLPK